MGRLELVREEEDDAEYRRRVMTALVDRAMGVEPMNARAREMAATVMEIRSRGPAWRRLGVGWQLGLAEVPGVVLVESHDSESVRGFFTPAAAVVEVWGGDEEAVRAMVEARRHVGVVVLVVHRRASWWLRMKLRVAYAWRRIARAR